MEKVEGVTYIGDPKHRRTEAELHFDALLQERRHKGRETYGQGLEHTDSYDWNRMAMEEALDLAQYLAAENLRLRQRLSALEKNQAAAVEQALLTI
jgi:hypothetical protein